MVGIKRFYSALFISVVCLPLMSGLSSAQTFNIQKQNTNFSIDGNGGAIQRQQVYLWNTSNSNVNQQWEQISRSGGHHSFRKRNTNLCLDGGNGGALRQAVVLLPCTASNQNQHWKKVRLAVGSELYRIEKRNSPGFSIDGNSGARQRQSLYLWSSNNNVVNQQWNFINVNGGSVTPPSGNGTTVTARPGRDTLQAAINSVSNAGGGVVRLVSGTYRLTRSVEPKSNVRIVGAGPNSTVTWDSSVARTINTALFLKINGTINDISFENFKIRCTVDKSNASDRNRNLHHGIYMAAGGSQFDASSLPYQNIRMTNMEIRECGGEGVQIKGANNFTGIDLKFYNNGWGTVDLWHNFYLKRVRNVVIKQTNANSGFFKNSPAGHGMRMSDLDDVYLENLTITGNADHGIHMDNVSNFRGNNLNTGGNCALPRGACRPAACYGSCDFNLNARRE